MGIVYQSLNVSEAIESIESSFEEIVSQIETVLSGKQRERIVDSVHTYQDKIIKFLEVYGSESHKNF